MSTDVVRDTDTVSLSGWLTVVVAAVLAIWILDVARLKIIEVNEAALGGQTTAVLAESDGLQVSCSDALDSGLCEDAYRRADHMPAVLWFGNSQNFAINRYKPGDELAVVIVHRWLKNRGTWLVSYTQPNANLNEEALLFEALTHRYDTRRVIIPVFMDKLREHGIRQEITKFMDDPKTADRVRRSPAWGDISPFLTKEPELGVQSSLQNWTENMINSTMEQSWPLWRDRSKLRSNLGFALHILRNQLFGIHSYTTRIVDPKVYAEKMVILDKLLQSADAQKLKVLLYIPPYRKDIRGPYDDDQYTKFKVDVGMLAAKYSADFVDLDNTVPGPLWATVVDTIFGFEEPDFMHFTAEGHQRLADAIKMKLSDLGF